jgi:transglutaminase-like putative cysteine protease
MAKTSSSFSFKAISAAKMPREQRDTLFILGTLLFILLPHFFYLPVWASVLTCLTLLWRAWLTRGTAKLPGLLIKISLLVFFVGATLISYKTIAGPQAGGTLLVMLVSLKTLELRARRDALIIFYLGFFLIMMSFFESQNILIALCMLISLTALMAALINAHMPAGYPPLKDSIRIALRLMLWGTPFMVILFLTFPRLDPLWALPDPNVAKTGVSDELSINSISELVQNQAIAFRVKFEGNAPAQKDLYFRGPVLSLFDGRVWRARDIPMHNMLSAEEKEAYFTFSSPAVHYEITQETTNQNWLFTLDLTPPQGAPALNSNRAQIGYGGQWAVGRIISDRIRYNATAYFNYRLGSNTPPNALYIETLLPSQSNPRTQAWAKQLMQDPSFAALDPRGKAQWLLNYIRQENFHYTLQPPIGYTAATAADQLWFDYRAGFCEHYASAFVVLMRALNIPARIVTGYQGAEPNFIDSYWIVRQSNAHAWTEIWQPGEGWIRIDPTSAIAPYRINNGSLFLTDENAGNRSFANLPFIDKLLMRWDALENYWNQWVLAYSVDAGIDLLSRLGIKNASWGTLVKILLGITGAVLLVLLLIIRWKNRTQDHWLKAYAVLRQKLQKAGFPSDATTAPRTLAKQLAGSAAQQPQLQQAQHLLLRLEKLRYAPSASQHHSLKEVIREVHRFHIS